MLSCPTLADPLPCQSCERTHLPSTMHRYTLVFVISGSLVPSLPSSSVAMSTPLLQSPAKASDGSTPQSSIQSEQPIPIPSTYPVISQQVAATTEPTRCQPHVAVTIPLAYSPSIPPCGSRWTTTIATVLPIMVLFVGFVIAGIIGPFLPIATQATLFACMLVIVGGWKWTHSTGNHMNEMR